MNQDERVMGRRGARELTPSEVEVVMGAFKFYTICTPGDADCGNGIPPCDSVPASPGINVFTICTGSRSCPDGDCA